MKVNVLCASLISSFVHTMNKHCLKWFEKELQISHTAMVWKLFLTFSLTWRMRLEYDLIKINMCWNSNSLQLYYTVWNSQRVNQRWERTNKTTVGRKHTSPKIKWRNKWKLKMPYNICNHSEALWGRELQYIPLNPLIILCGNSWAEVCRFLFSRQC